MAAQKRAHMLRVFQQPPEAGTPPPPPRPTEPPEATTPLPSPPHTPVQPEVAPLSASPPRTPAPTEAVSQPQYSEVPSTSTRAARGNITSAEIRSMWATYKVRDQLGTAEQCIQFAEENGLVLRSTLCSTHRTPMPIYSKGNSDLGSFCCRMGQCRTKSSVRRAKGTWFENAKLSLPHIFYLKYCYSRRFTQFNVQLEDYFGGPCLSSRTITDWCSYRREAVVIYQIDKQEHVGKIGGPGKIVQIDESKFGKRKFNKGRIVEGHWVLGMIEDGSEYLRLEVCPENVRFAEVLIPLIQKHVIEGTIIRTDYWKAYDCLSSYGYEHQKVNHSDPENPFVAPDGTHTQRIESQWRVVKSFFHKDNFNNPANFADLVVEFLWRKSILKNREHPFTKLIDAIKRTYKQK
ncbi:PREDICTED: uncharacterized protein LOC108362406 [Rhagoletis zephyria]|uniref:uncharacterized protein LOC108362406 n=1 Tax=Rhagoletis zephyria TaxID=28612 RepID=UPI0008115448|nr:PREDICTED: uncharacterized protein LOC108362406 [Rhagoletis zephyria]